MSANDVTDGLSLVVADLGEAARGIRRVELRDSAGGVLPVFTPGAHVDISVEVGPGDVRRSRHWLCNAPAQADRYVILVKQGEDARCVTAGVFDALHIRSVVRCSLPDNTFSFPKRAPSLLFIAEDIGIAPVASILCDLGPDSERDVHLYYLAADAASAPFADELRAAWGDRVVIHHDQGRADNAFDLWPILERPSGAYVYCCGRRALLESVRDMTGHWPASRIHLEAIGGSEETKRIDDHAFRVKLARSGQSVDVAAGQTILDALRLAGHNVPSSCESGTCGTCRTRLLEGTADHRDLVLGEDEHGDYIMVCVSRAKSAELTIDR